MIYVYTINKKCLALSTSQINRFFLFIKKNESGLEEEEEQCLESRLLNLAIFFTTKESLS